MELENSKTAKEVDPDNSTKAAKEEDGLIKELGGSEDNCMDSDDGSGKEPGSKVDNRQVDGLNVDVAVNATAGMTSSTANTVVDPKDGVDPFSPHNKDSMEVCLFLSS